MDKCMLFVQYQWTRFNNSSIERAYMNIEAAVTRYIDLSPPPNAVQREVTLPSSFDFIVSIIGPRRAGKTTFMLEFREKLNVPKENKIFLNCEDINLLGIRSDDLQTLEETMLRIYSPVKGFDVYLFIDEVQNIPNWERWLRTLHDSRKYKVVVSGSTSELSTHKMHSALRGRAINTLILPFSFREFLAAKGVEYKEYMPPQKVAALEHLFDEYVSYGGYPSVVLSADINQKIAILHEIFDTVIQRDIIEKYRIRQFSAFKIFINSLLGSVGRQFSLRKMTNWLVSQGIDIGRQTALNYLEAAEDVFFLYRLPPFTKRARERLVNPKLYVVDSGILSLASRDYSKQLENQVFVELFRRKVDMGYWLGSSGKEVDFVINKDGKLTLLQVTYSLSDQATYDREISSLKEADKQLNADHLIILTKSEGERKVKLGEKDVVVQPAWKWFITPCSSLA
jgi:predicted AAA+ superfamily ATPase